MLVGSWAVSWECFLRRVNPFLSPRPASWGLHLSIPLPLPSLTLWTTTVLRARHPIKSLCLPSSLRCLADPWLTKECSSVFEFICFVFQTGYLIEQLTTEKYECMVCCESVRVTAPVWSCQSCYHVFHLNCIKKWARSPASQAGQSFLSSE